MIEVAFRAEARHAREKNVEGPWWWKLCQTSKRFVFYCSHTVMVTDSLLRSLISHQTVLRIWEGKDKVTSKARF